jgi:3-oxoacyl-[acyl-carrier-protein] synthase-3
LPRTQESVTEKSAGADLVLRAIAETSADPFQGSRLRRVAPLEMPCSEMEARAGRDALSRAGVSAAEVDLLLSSTLLPDYMGVNHASIVHHRLGLASHCPAITVDAVCNSVFAQLDFAQAMFAAGRARVALLTQSCAATRIMAREDPVSACHGDGASALVVRKGAPGSGLIQLRSHTDGALHGGFVLGVPNARWYEGKVVAYPADRVATRRMMLAAPDLARRLVQESLAEVGLDATAVTFFASHQPTSWFRRLTQDYCGLAHAASVDVFPWSGSVVAATIPLQLATAEREYRLHTGDLVVIFGIASGMSAYAALLRWN